MRIKGAAQTVSDTAIFIRQNNSCVFPSSILPRFSIMQLMSILQNQEDTEKETF